jgi:hypothetical protein
LFTPSPLLLLYYGFSCMTVIKIPQPVRQAS